MWIEIILNIDIHLSYSFSLFLESYPAMKQITKTLEEIDEENIIGLRIIYFENTIWLENLQLKKKSK